MWDPVAVLGWQQGRRGRRHLPSVRAGAGLLGPLLASHRTPRLYFISSPDGRNVSLICPERKRGRAAFSHPE